MKTDSNFNLIWSRNFGGSYALSETGGSNFEGDLIVKNNMVYVFLKSLYDISLPDFDIECGHAPDTDDAWLVAFDLTTAISDVPEKQNYSIYPNPASDVIKIESSGRSSPLQIEIYNISGVQVLKNVYDASAHISINTENLSGGIYVIKISGQETIYTEKIIITH